MSKTTIFPTIESNFTTLLRAGAFGSEDRALEVMSPFKWRKLFKLADDLRLRGYIHQGALLLDKEGIIPSELKEGLHTQDAFISDEAQLYGFFSRKNLDKISETELKDESPSFKTLTLLELIISVADEIIENRQPLNGIISLGRYLREEGDQVDYVKLEQWIKKLGITSLAEFQAAILKEIFSFEDNEFPYIRGTFSKAYPHYQSWLCNAHKKANGIKTSTKLNIALGETSFYHLNKFIFNIKNVEE